MKFVLITKDPEVAQASKGAFQPDDEILILEDWSQALAKCDGADMMFVDMVATLDKPHKIAGYEKFAEAKMDDPVASTIPLALIWPPEDYELDFYTGYPNFVFQQINRPVTFQKLRRASTYL